MNISSIGASGTGFCGVTKNALAELTNRCYDVKVGELSGLIESPCVHLVTREDLKESYPWGEGSALAIVKVGFDKFEPVGKVPEYCTAAAADFINRQSTLAKESSSKISDMSRDYACKFSKDKLDLIG